MMKYKAYLNSLLAMTILTCLVLSFQSFSYYNLGETLSLLVSDFSISNLTELLNTFFSYFTLVNCLNVSFIVALFFLCIYGFKWLDNQGAYYTFQYSWQKSKRHVLFFLPKYWGNHKSVDKENDLDLETGEKIYHTYESFVEHKQSTQWDNINQLFASACSVIALTIIVSYLFIS